MTNKPTTTSTVSPHIGNFARLWLLISTCVGIIDASFVLSRPLSLQVTDGIFAQWVTYATFDRRYGIEGLNDPFCNLQAYLKLAEGFLNMIAVLTSFFVSTRTFSTKVACYVSLMTLYKTVIFFGMDFFEGGKYTNHNTPQDKFLNVQLPALFWIIIPFWLYHTGMHMLTLKKKN